MKITPLLLQIIVESLFNNRDFIIKTDKKELEVWNSAIILLQFLRNNPDLDWNFELGKPEV